MQQDKDYDFEMLHLKPFLQLIKYLFNSKVKDSDLPNSMGETGREKF